MTDSDSSSPASPIPIRRHTQTQRSPSPATSSSSVASPVPTRKTTHSLELTAPQTPSKKIKQSSSNVPCHSSPSFKNHLDVKNLNLNLNLNRSSESPKKTAPIKQRPVRIKRPIRKQPVNQDQIPSSSATTNLEPPLDEDDFFNLSSHNPIQFVSKTLGLTQTTVVVPSHKSNSKSPTRRGKSIEPSQSQHQILLDLDNDDAIDLEGASDDDTDDDSDDSDDDTDHNDNNINYDQKKDGNQVDNIKSIHKSKKSKSKSSNKKVNSRNLPDWTKASKITQIDSSSDEEKGLDDIEDPDRFDMKIHNQRASTTTRRKTDKQPEMKSRSPTPPPLGNPMMIQNAMKKLYQEVAQKDTASQLQKQALEAQRRAEEVELAKLLDEVDDLSIPINPPASAYYQQQNYNHTPGNSSLAIASPVTFHASMVLDPRLYPTMSKEVKDQYERPIVFQISSNQKFALVYQKFQQLSAIPFQRLVVTHDNIKLSPFVTPESINIFSHATLKVYDSATWDYVSFLRRQRIHVSVGSEAEDISEKRVQAEAEEGDFMNDGINKKESYINETHEEEEEEEGISNGQELINITVRNKDKSSLDLLVKPTTSIKSIVKNFLININLHHPNTSSPSLLDLENLENLNEIKKFKILFDGQNLNLNSTVYDNDICDQDILDFVFV